MKHKNDNRSASQCKSSKQSVEKTITKLKSKNTKWAIVLTICHEPGLGHFIANRTKPYRVTDARTAHNVLGTLRNKVVVADKATLIANGFDLCEEDFTNPLELPILNKLSLINKLP